MADELPPPIEIPWSLAATTQPLDADEPEESAISLFTFTPDDSGLTAGFPDERLVYLKFTVTISPADLPRELPPVAGSALGEGIPCFHVVLDLRIRRPGGDTGTIRPYFHAAAPMNRRLIQTGVVGSETFEGEADGQFMGKSGTQMYETSSTSSRTTSYGANAGFSYAGFSIGGSARRTSTDVDSQRASSQVVDTTTREASQERRELVSHHTHVENVLTLLSAKYVGTPYLRFSLAPQPLSLLSLDPSDPNLWFSQLLARRSAGIEGVQEFTAAVLVPRGEDFCVEARLERVCVLDAPPGPLTFEESYNYAQHFGRILEYLNRSYPPGTPLDELDVDIVGGLPNPDDFERGVVTQWFPFPVSVAIGMQAPGKSLLDEVKSAATWYKQSLEVWHDTLRDEYERDVARSPLERGVIVADERTLDTCFGFSEAGTPTVTKTSVESVPLHQVGIDPHEITLGGVTSGASSARASVRERAFEAATRGNLLESRLATLLANRRKDDKPRDRELRLDDSRLVGVLLEAWAKLRPGDPRNVDFDTAAKALRLDDGQCRALREAGATDLRGIAAAIRSAPTLARHNATIEELAELRDAGPAAKTMKLEPPVAGLPLVVADAAHEAIGSALARGGAAAE